MKNLNKLRIKRGCTSIIICISVLFLFTEIAAADNIVTSGTTLKVLTGTTLVSVGTLTLKSGGILNNQGTIVLQANFDNQNPGTTDLGTGTYVLNGTSVQAVNGTNTFGVLTINNTSDATLNGYTKVNATLNLTSGIITINANSLLLGNSATVGGSPSASSMVIANGAGEFRKSFSGTGSFTFPVGDNNVVSEYSPVMLTFTSGSFGGGNYAGINLVNAAYPTSSGSYLNRYWNISQSGITSFACNAMFQYIVADVVGTESQIYCGRVLPAPPVYYDVANTTLHQLTANGLTAFGTFTGQVDIYIGIDSQPNEDAFYRVYPNPSSGKFHLEMPDHSNKKNVSVSIYNLQGQLVFNQGLKPGSQEFQVQLPAGVYVLKIQSAERTQQELITIQ